MISTDGVKAKEIFKSRLSSTNFPSLTPSMAVLYNLSSTEPDPMYDFDNTATVPLLVYHWHSGNPTQKEPTDDFIDELFKQPLTGLCRVLGEGGKFYDANDKLLFEVVKHDREGVLFKLFLNGEKSELAFVDPRVTHSPRGETFDIGCSVGHVSETCSAAADYLVRSGNRYDPIFPHLEFSHLTAIDSCWQIIFEIGGKQLNYHWIERDSEFRVGTVSIFGAICTV